MRRRLVTLLLVAFLAPLRAAAIDVQEVEQGAPGAEGEDGESVTAGAVGVAPGDEPAQVTATARGGSGGPAGPATAAGDGGRARLGRVFGASSGGEVVVNGAALGGPGGARWDALPAGDGASVRLANKVDGETTGALHLVQSAHGGDAGGAGGRPGGAESILVRAKRAAALDLHSGAFAGAGPDLSPGDFEAPGADAAATADGSNAGGSATVHGLAFAGLGGIRQIDGAGLAGGDAHVFAAGTTRCRGCAVRVGSPFAPRYAPRPARGLAPSFVAMNGGAFAARGGGFPIGLLDTGGIGGGATSLSLGRARRDAPVVVFDVARGGTGGTSLRIEGARGGDAESVAFGAGRGSSPVEVHADAEGGAVGPLLSLSIPPPPIGAGVPGGSAFASADAEGRGRVVADARAAAGASQLGDSPGASAEARAFALGRSGEVRAAAGSIGRALDVEARAIAELASHASSVARAATAAALPRRPREADAFARSASAPPEAALREPRFPGSLRQALESGGLAWIEAIGALGGTRPVGHGRAGARLAFEVDLRSASPLSRRIVSGVVVGFEAPKLPRRFEALRVSVVKEQQILFDATFRDRDDAQHALAGRLVAIGTLGAVFEGEGFRRTVRPELARLRVELTGVVSSEEFALRYAVAARPGVVPVLPIVNPGLGEPLSSGFNDGFGGVILRGLDRVELGAVLRTTERVVVDLSGLR